MANLIQALPSTSQVYLDNLTALTERTRGQKFIVGRKGKLRVVSGIFDRVRYFILKRFEQHRVKKAINKTLSKIDLKKSEALAIKNLFFLTLKPLSERVYARKKLSPELIYLLKGSDSAGSLDRLATKVEKVRFAVKLGVDFQPVSEGNSGTYYGRDYQGNRLVVFKPSDEEGSSVKCPKLSGKIKSIFFKIFPFMRSHQNINRECAYLNEIGASKVDRLLGLHIVPNTRLETFQSEKFEGEVEKKGSCQEFVKGAKMLQEALGMPTFKHTSFLKRVLQKLWLLLFGSHKKSLIPVQELKKLAIIEFLTGNQDGHTNNQLLSPKKIHAIDYGLAFPSAPPDRLVSTLNQYHFAYLPGADNAFTVNDLALIKPLENPVEFFTQISSEMTDEDVLGFTEEQKEAMKERIQILQAVIAQGKSIAYLGKIKFACDFERAREELGIAEQI